jgi:argininosuccinate lyase
MKAPEGLCMRLSTHLQELIPFLPTFHCCIISLVLYQFQNEIHDFSARRKLNSIKYGSKAILGGQWPLYLVSSGLVLWTLALSALNAIMGT